MLAHSSCLTICSVMKTVYERSVASHDGGPQLTARESFEVFKTDVMQHATATAAGEAALFDFPAVTRVSEHSNHSHVVHSIHREHNF
jgi:hypothetical protein